MVYLLQINWQSLWQRNSKNSACTDLVLSTQLSNAIPLRLLGQQWYRDGTGSWDMDPVWRLEGSSPPSWDVKDPKYDVTPCPW